MPAGPPAGEPVPALPDVDALVRRMGSSSEQVVQEGAQLAQVSAQVAERSRDVAAGVQELGEAIEAVSEGARLTSEIAESVLARSVGAGERMARLQDASREIDEVTLVIAAITGQTRTLALNATIEAARAGEAGRGFAVVASEVKELASATAQAAERIGAQIRAVQAETDEAGRALDQITETLRRMFEVHGGTATAVAHQTSLALRIRQDVDEAARGSEQIADLVRRRAAALRSDYVGQALEVAQAVLAHAGGVRLGEGTVTWRATDQFSQAVTAVRLPPLCVGDRPVPRNDDPGTPSLLVDEVRRLVGGAVTLFQRMGPDGALLRVATTVLDARGRRAVGTYQPVARADGTANPVVAEVVRGRTYTGDAVILGRPYFTAYAPLHDGAGALLGALFVGLPQE